MIPLSSRWTPECLKALSRLNSHARAFGFGKKAIYAYKTFIACAFAEEARPVQVLVKCHHCNGTGTYRDWDGYDRGPCYRCTRGVRTLRFIESRVGDMRWHHPMGGDTDGGNVLNAAWDIVSVAYPQSGAAYPDGLAKLADGTERPIIYEQAEGWGPRMPDAEKLPTDEACRLLNLVERALDDVPTGGRNPCIRWPREKALREIGRYQIDLARIEEGCHVCGATEKLTNCCSMSWGHGFVSFARPMCPTCHGIASPHRWPAEPHADSLTPNVEAWLAHPLRQRQRVVEHEYA